MTVAEADRVAAVLVKLLLSAAKREQRQGGNPALSGVLEVPRRASDEQLLPT